MDTLCRQNIKFSEGSTYCKPVVSNDFIYWGASDGWLWRRGRPVAIATIIIIIIIIIIQFFIYLRAELNSQWPVTESARIQTTAIRKRTKQTKKKKQENREK
jgi:hypothetical protein